MINYCLDNDIGILVVGYNKTFQKNSYISKSKNQSFVDIPYDILQDKLEYLCKSNDIILVANAGRIVHLISLLMG